MFDILGVGGASTCRMNSADQALQNTLEGMIAYDQSMAPWKKKNMIRSIEWIDTRVVNTTGDL